MSLFKRATRPGNSSSGDQAAYWLARRELGLLRRDEEEVFERWRALPENAAAFDNFESMLSRVQSTASQPAIVQMRTEIMGRPPHRPLLLGNVPASIAAAVLAGLVILLASWFAHRSPTTTGQAPGATALKLAPATYATVKGEQRQISLADGSRLSLNTDSRVEVAFDNERRLIRLIRGQGLFDVAKDKSRPFKVAAGPLEVLALGTRFDVRLDNDSAKVVLIEGWVRVEPLAHEGIARIIPTLDRRTLDAGQQLVASRSGKLTVETADVEQATSWRQGRLIFRGEPLSLAVQEFNRYNARQLGINDPALARLPVSGVFSATRPENFLIALSAFYPIDIEQRSPQLTSLALKPTQKPK